MEKSPEKDIMRSCVDTAIDENLNMLKKLFFATVNKDFISRRFKTCGFEAVLVYIEGMSGGDKMNEGILEPCLTATAPENLAVNDRADYMIQSVLNISDIEKTDLISELVESLLAGKSALILDGCDQALLLETRAYEKRSVERAQNEPALIGSQQGFIENLRTNITLVRRMVRSPALVTELVSVGSQIPTQAAIMYIKGVVDEKILDTARRRILSLNVDHVENSGQLMSLIEDSSFQMIPQILQTERPDRAAHSLVDGQIAILLDNSPYALIAPITIFHLLHATDDSYLRWQYGTFTRVLRLLASLVALFLPAIYIALTSFHQHLIPLDLLTSIAETRAKVPFPILIEMLILEFSFYLINEAGTRMPSQIGSALGIVGGLILGQAAVAADLISPILIIIVAISGLCSYVAPVYGLTIAMEILRLFAIFMAALLGLIGVIITGFIYCCGLCAAKSMGISMMAPFSPYRPHNPDLVTRLPVWMQKRKLFIARKDSWLKKTDGSDMREWKEDGEK
ncbi:MAG: spore germination protein [Clostridia bacterium]|nr:spore germination protein [Clostridia bacterium]